MDDTEALVPRIIYSHAIFLDENIISDLKYKLAQKIIVNYELSLTVEQILIAFEKIDEWLNNHALQDQEYSKNIRLFLFDKILNINKNLYTALILALCDSFDVSGLWNFIIIRRNIPIDIGINKIWSTSAINGYKKLLDYYEFDISSIQTISGMDKQTIQDYHNEKYVGKLTKRATKK